MSSVSTILGLLLIFLTETALADTNAGILWGGNTSAKDLREGNISFDTIPQMISYATEFILGFAATVAMIMIIYGAFQMSIMALTAEDKKKGMDTVKNGIIGFALAVSAWLIVKVIISNL